MVGLFGRSLAKLAAPVAVLFVDRKTHPIWGNSWTKDFSWWNTGVRNGAYNLSRIPMPLFATWSDSGDYTLEAREGFQWRYRRSTCGKYVSFRCTWGKPRKSKGKREFYVGWKMRPNFEDNLCALTFFQFRPF